MQRATKAPLAPATLALYNAGLSPMEVANRTGLAVAYVRNLLNGHAISRPGRAKIEAACGFPLWSPPAEFYARQNPTQKIPAQMHK